MLNEFPYNMPSSFGKARVCVVNSQFRAYMDRDAAIDLLYSLYWIAKDEVVGEDIYLNSDSESEFPSEGETIQCCKINSVQVSKHKKIGKDILKEATTIRHKPLGDYSSEQSLLVFNVGVEEIREAYQTLSELLAIENDYRKIRDVALFGTLMIRLIVY